MNDAQTLKLRQLSLLSLAKDRRNLSYDKLKAQLGLETSRELEDLVITAIYADLIHATLDPARQFVQVTSVSPLRDLSPGSVPDMITALKTWSSRCSSTLEDLETQINTIRATAAKRERKRRIEQQEIDTKLREAMTGEDDGSGKQSAVGAGKKKLDAIFKRSNSGRRDEDMEVDDEDERKLKSSKRKM